MALESCDGNKVIKENNNVPNRGIQLLTNSQELVQLFRVTKGRNQGSYTHFASVGDYRLHDYKHGRTLANMGLYPKATERIHSKCRGRNFVGRRDSGAKLLLVNLAPQPCLTGAQHNPNPWPPRQSSFQPNRCHKIYLSNTHVFEKHSPDSAKLQKPLTSSHTQLSNKIQLRCYNRRITLLTPAIWCYNRRITLMTPAIWCYNKRITLMTPAIC